MTTVLVVLVGARRDEIENKMRGESEHTVSELQWTVGEEREWGRRQVRL